MSRCRRDSFYLAPGVLRYFKDHTLATWNPETGSLVRFFHRSDVAAFAARFPAWDGICLLSERGGLAVLQKTLRADPSKVELWRLDARLVEGRRPADACSYVMHRWATEGVVPGGAKSLVPLLFPSAEPLHKGLHAAALHAIGDNAQLAVHVVSSAWRAGLFSSPAQAASILRDLAPLAKGFLVEPDPRLVSMFSAGLDPANVDLKKLLTELANPYTHINPASISLMLDLNPSKNLLHRLELQADEHMLLRIWDHPNYPRDAEYIASVRRAAGSNSEDIRKLAAGRRDLPDEVLLEFAASTDSVLAMEALDTLERRLREVAGPNRAGHTARFGEVAKAAWGSSDARVKCAALKFAGAFDANLEASLADDFFRNPPTLDEDNLDLHVAAALARCLEGGPVSEDAWVRIGKVLDAVPSTGFHLSWDLGGLRYVLGDSHRPHHASLGASNPVSPPQHIIDSVIASKNQRLIEALADNPKLDNRSLLRILEIDSDGSLTRTVAHNASDLAVLSDLVARDKDLARGVARNTNAPRELLLAIATNKALYNDSDFYRTLPGDRDEYGLLRSPYEEAMLNPSLSKMGLEEVELFLAAQRGDGKPRARDEAETLRGVVHQTSDPEVIRRVVDAHSGMWYHAIDNPNIPADMRRAFIAAIASGKGDAVGLDQDLLLRIAQNWLSYPKTLPNDELWSLAGSPLRGIARLVVENQNPPADLLEYLFRDKEKVDSDARLAVLSHKNTPKSVIDGYIANPPPPHLGGHSEGFRKVSEREDLSQESAWTLAGSKDSSMREYEHLVSLASNPALDADLIRLLAGNKDPVHPNRWDDILKNLAQNRSTPLDVLLVLAKDGAVPVRVSATRNPNLPQDYLLAMLKDEDSLVVRSAIASCYDRGISLPTETLAAVFEHPDVYTKFIDRGWEREHWWKQEISMVPSGYSSDTSPLAFAGRMLDYEDPKALALVEKLLDSGSFNTDPDMHECASRLLNRPLPLRLQTLEEQRQMNTTPPEMVESLEDVGRATAPYPVEGMRAELTDRLATAPMSDVPGYGPLAARVIKSPAAQRHNGNYMGNCTFSYHGPETQSGYKIVVGLYGEGSNDPVLNALLRKTSDGWLIQEVNSRFNPNVTSSAAEAVASTLGLPLDSGPYAHKYLPG